MLSHEVLQHSDDEVHEGNEEGNLVQVTVGVGLLEELQWWVHRGGRGRAGRNDSSGWHRLRASILKSPLPTLSHTPGTS